MDRSIWRFESGSLAALTGDGFLHSALNVRERQSEQRRCPTISCPFGKAVIAGGLGTAIASFRHDLTSDVPHFGS